MRRGEQFFLKARLPSLRRKSHPQTLHRYQLNRENLRANPHIATAHFHDRFTSFFRLVLQPIFGIQDYWHRYEFQGRGSTHVHGFAWIDETAAPEATISLDTEHNRALFTEFWKRHILAMNPEPGRQRAGKRTRGVYNMRSPELQNTLCQLSDSVNRTQVHVCSESYCLRCKKGAPPAAAKSCRFYFPRAVGEAETSKVRSSHFRLTSAFVN